MSEKKCCDCVYYGIFVNLGTGFCDKNQDMSKPDCPYYIKVPKGSHHFVSFKTKDCK